MTATGAQRRHVTFLFADLVGSSALSERLDAETFHALIDDWLQAMTGEVERFGGTLNQFSGDGILVLFGAPLAQEDAPVQACRAALALQRRLRTLDSKVPLVMRIGVDSGEIVAGLVGTDRRNEYAALGQRTNRAKRVQEQADPGSILISEDTEALVREYFRLLPAGELVAKGFAAPVVGYRLIDEREQGAMPRLAAAMSRWHSPLVGRTAALEQCDRAMRQAVAGESRAVAIRGAAGVGKSRLLYELVERARARGFAVYLGRCTTMRAHVPYAPYADVLRALCGISKEDSGATITDKLRTRFAEDLLLLREVVAPSPTQVSHVSHSAHADARMLATHSAIERAVATQTRQLPVALLLDDIDRADPLSRQLTARILQRCGNERLLILTASRECCAEIAGPIADTVELGPLSNQDVEELVGRLPGLAETDVSRLSAWLQRQAGGLPLFIEELLVSLQSRGKLRCDESNRWQLACDFESEHLPGNVHDLIASRIDALAPTELQSLQAAAVIGEQLRPADLSALGCEDAAATMSRLEQLGFVVADSGAEWRFHSALARRVAYRSIPRAQREALHLRLADALMGAATPVDETVVASHFQHGGDAVQAVKLLRRAAARAEWAFANTDAVALLSEVMIVGSEVLSPPERAEVLIERGRLRTAYLGDGAGLSDIDEAIDLTASTSGAAAVHTHALLAKGIAMYRQFQFQESLHWLERAGHAAIACGLPELQIEALLQRAFVLSEARISAAPLASATSARECCEQALSLSRTLGHHELEIQALHSLGTAYLQELDYDHAYEMFAHCVERSRAAGDRATEALALQSLARVQQFRGDFSAAISSIRELQTLLRQLGDRRRLAFSTFNLAAAYLGCGLTEEARAAAREALPQAAQLGLDYLEKLVLRFVIGLSTGAEFLRQRIEAGERLRCLLKGDDERAELSDLLDDLAAGYVAAGETERALGTLTEAVKLDVDLANFNRARSSLARLQQLSPRSGGGRADSNT